MDAMNNGIEISYYATRSGKLVGASLDDGDTMVNALGRTVPVPAGLVECDAPDDVPAAMAEAVRVALVDAAAAVTAREQHDAAVAERRAQAERDAANAAERRAAARRAEAAYWASPEGQARQAREIELLRVLTRAVMRVTR